MSTTKSGGNHLQLSNEGSFMNRDGCVLMKKVGSVGGVEYVLGVTDDILGANSFRSETFTVEVQMVVTKQGSNRICPIMQPDKTSFQFANYGVSMAHEKGKNYVYPEHIVHGTQRQHCKIRSSVLGSAIQQRLGSTIVELRVAPVARFIDERTKIVVDSLSFHLRVGHSYFNKELQEEKGVSILHLLEELEGQTC